MVTPEKNLEFERPPIAGNSVECSFRAAQQFARTSLWGHLGGNLKSSSCIL